MPNHCNLADSIITCHARRSSLIAVSLSCLSQPQPTVSSPSLDIWTIPQEGSHLNLQATFERASYRGKWGHRCGWWAFDGGGSFLLEVASIDRPCLVLRVSPISFTVGSALSLWAGEFFILQTEDTKMWKCLKPPYWVKVAIVVLLVRRMTNPSQFRNDRCMHAKSHPTLCNSMDWAHQAPVSMGFSRQEY